MKRRELKVSGRAYVVSEAIVAGFLIASFVSGPDQGLWEWLGLAICIAAAIVVLILAVGVALRRVRNS